jgi:hypothetical protein
MTASKDTLVQVNFKTRNGTLINVYGNDEPSFDLGLAIIQDRIATFTEIEQQLSGAGVVGEQVALASVQPPAAAGVPDVAPAAPPAASWGQPPAPAPAAAFTAGAVRQCAHGVMTARSGQSARGPWKAYMCPTPKGTPGQCAAQFLDNKSAEWNTFAA